MAKSWLSALWATLFLTACTQIGPYQTKISSAVSGHLLDIDPQHQFQRDPTGGDNGYRLGFVEFDEFGHLFNRKQLDDVVSQLDSPALQESIVIVFVHGWHHNAAPDDPNLSEFKNLLKIVTATEQNMGINPRPVVGLFVGWRGESLKQSPLNVFTFWERKNVAQAIGHGGVTELYSRLAAIHDRQIDHGRSRLIIVGHSFGGALTYSAISQVALDRLSRLPRKDGEPTRVRPLGDLVILLNPAFEAMLYRPLFDLSLSREYRKDQLPVMMTITTENDTATRYAFPAGRFVSTLFDTYADDDGPSMNTTAIGHYLPFITHVLRPTTDCVSREQDISKGELHLKDAIQQKLLKFRDVELDRKCFDLKSPGHDNAPALLLIRNDKPESGGDLTKGKFLSKGLVSAGLAPYHNPFMNIRTTSEVMDGHNGIWSNNLRSFLWQVIALTAHAEKEPPQPLPMMRPPSKMEPLQ